MLLDQLQIVHLHTDESSQREYFRSVVTTAPVCLVETCLRAFAVGTRDRFEGVNHDMQSEGFDCFYGEDAYAWLLAVSCGLYSRVTGETEIFSQVKTSWNTFTQQAGSIAAELNGCMQKLFADVKQIRAQHLQGIGGASYGTLTRKLLNCLDGEHVAVIGAGQLVEAVVPYFQRQRLLIWNRSAARLEHLFSQIRGKTFTELSLSTSLPELYEVCTKVSAVVICTPVLKDAEIALFNELKKQNRKIKVVHLGAQEQVLAHWRDESGLIDVFTLVHVFALQSEQNELKEMRIKKALLACQQQANLRYLMDAITINHGWEDLISYP